MFCRLLTLVTQGLLVAILVAAAIGVTSIVDGDKEATAQSGQGINPSPQLLAQAD